MSCSPLQLMSLSRVFSVIYRKTVVFSDFIKTMFFFYLLFPFKYLQSLAATVYLQLHFVPILPLTCHTFHLLYYKLFLAFFLNVLSEIISSIYQLCLLLTNSFTPISYSMFCLFSAFSIQTLSIRSIAINFSYISHLEQPNIRIYVSFSILSSQRETSSTGLLIMVFSNIFSREFLYIGQVSRKIVDRLNYHVRRYFK